MDLAEDTCLFFWLVNKDSAFLETDENLADLSPSPGSKVAEFHLMGFAPINGDGCDPPRREVLSFLLASPLVPQVDIIHVNSLKMHF